MSWVIQIGGVRTGRDTQSSWALNPWLDVIWVMVSSSRREKGRSELAQKPLRALEGAMLG